MDKGMKLINAMNALTLAVAALTDKVTTEYLKSFETIYDPEKDEPQKEQKDEKKKPEQEQQAVTFIQLRSRLSEISRNGHTSEIKEIIAKYGAEKLSDISESDYAALLAEAEAL